jgi:hypothetical protein
MRTELLEKYRESAEALHDALLAFGTRMHTEGRGEYARLRKLVENCEDDLDQARQEFKRAMPEDPKRNG